MLFASFDLISAFLFFEKFLFKGVLEIDLCRFSKFWSWRQILWCLETFVYFLSLNLILLKISLKFFNALNFPQILGMNNFKIISQAISLHNLNMTNFFTLFTRFFLSVINFAFSVIIALRTSFLSFLLDICLFREWNVMPLEICPTIKRPILTN